MTGRRRMGRGALLLLPQRDAETATLKQRVYVAVRDAIRRGALAAGDRLPSTRNLAADLRVSRATVVEAYAALRQEGYIETFGRGVTRVSGAVPQSAEPLPGGPPATGGAVRGPSRRGQRLAGFWSHFPPIAERPARAFRTSVPALDVFPVDLWARLTARCARRATAASLAYGDPRGQARLREAIADYLRRSRGVRCTSGQVLVTAGAQQALDLVGRVLLDPGDAAWQEDPGYFGAGAALVAAGARPIPVPVDAEGLEVEAGRRLAPDARLAVVTPARQMPSGVTMSPSRRNELLRWANERRAWIVEDDYDSEFRYASPPVASLQSLDQSGCVLVMGTFSKLLYPGLRLGYLVVPPPLVEAFAAVRRFLDLGPPQLSQAVLAEFMEQGHLERHVRRMRTIYASRRDLLVALLERDLGLRVDAPDCGMNLILWLPQGCSDAAASRALAEVGVDALAFSSCVLQRARPPGLILGFSGVPENELREAVRPLGRVLEALRPGP